MTRVKRFSSNSRNLDCLWTLEKVQNVSHWFCAWRRRMYVQAAYIICDMIFRCKVRQICVCSDSFLLYVTSRIYYSHVYVIAEWKPLICTWERHRTLDPPAFHCGHYHIVIKTVSCRSSWDYSIQLCEKVSLMLSTNQNNNQPTKQTNKQNSPNKMVRTAKKGDRNKILQYHCIKKEISMLILCRRLLFPAQRNRMPLEMIQRQVTRMLKIMQWLPCKEQIS